MGSASSKFCKYIRNGDETAAVQLLNTSGELRKALDPNATYKGIHNNDTPLHCVCRQGLASLVRIFLSEFGGNPNQRSAKGETSMHCVCALETKLSDEQLSVRLECINLLLDWKGAAVSSDELAETVDLNAADCNGNTALHFAAASGVKTFVELLVAKGASVFAENCDKEVPCDVAEKKSYSDVALFLESKMVFSGDADKVDNLDVDLTQMEAEEGCYGLRAQDLLESKDHLVVETADMLHVPLFTAEALLRHHEWSRESMLESWIADPIACCLKCGVNAPKSLENHRSCSLRSSIIPEDPVLVPTHSLEDTLCEICAGVFSSTDIPVHIPWCHQFCRECWERYLCGKIQEGEAHHITCPGYQCDRLVPVELIETLVSRDMARRYLQFDIKAFVDTNPAIKWCPYPGCGRAVRMPENNPLVKASQISGRNAQLSDWSWSVDCGFGHSFCWECYGEAHDPASCKNWKSWLAKIAEIKPEELNGTEEALENSANCLWLVTNSKPCSNCKSPIQKNEGCNHIKCSKCKHDFCWVCLESWKKHSTATGGYFRCNRYEAVKKVEELQESLKTEAEMKNKRVTELNRFVHYYSRFKNHENSYKLEARLHETAKKKMEVLAKAMIGDEGMISDEELIEQEIKFITTAVTQLLKARHVLKFSYVYGYYLEQIGYKRAVFEMMQTEVEECTEMLSQMLSRPYLHTPRHKIVQAAQSVQRKRQELLGAIAKGLVPSDTSPSLKKKHNIFSVEVDERTRKVLLASLSKNPESSWVKGPSGKHTNVSALLDWPDDSDESDSENLTSPENGPVVTSSNGSHTDTSVDQSALDALQAESIATSGKCKRSGCRRLRVSNPRTGQLQEYCSIKCKNLDHQRLEETQTPDYMPDFNIDLQRALEMSRLQFLLETERGSFTEQANAEWESNYYESTSNHVGAGSLLDSSNTGFQSINNSNFDSHQRNKWDESSAVTSKELDVRLSHEDAEIGTSASISHVQMGNRILAESEANQVLPIGETACNGFGIIKDVKINNIVVADADKTEQFQAKNFKQIFCHSSVNASVSLV